MMISVITHPHDRIAGQRHRRACGKKKLEPLGHLKSPMSEVAMQIKRRADSAPEKNHQHDREVRKLETVEKTYHPQDLQSDQHDKDDEMDFFVLKHAEEDREKKREQP